LLQKLCFKQKIQKQMAGWVPDETKYPSKEERLNGEIKVSHYFDRLLNCLGKYCKNPKAGELNYISIINTL